MNKLKQRGSISGGEVALALLIICLISVIATPLILDQRKSDRILHDLKAIHPEIAYIVATNKKSVVTHYVVVVKNKDGSYNIYEIDQR